MATYITQLQCNVSSVFYDFETRTGTLVMDSGACCDMSGCIEYFKAIDPKVTRINTVSGTEIDTSYVIHAGSWRALLPTEVGWEIVDA